MIEIEINRNKIIEGEVDLPSSKSITNRVYIIKSITNDCFNIINPSDSTDSINLKSIIELISQQANNEIPQTLDVRDAGTNMRFLTALLSITKGLWIITGTERMKERPIKDLVEALISLGADIEYLNKKDYPPLLIRGKTIHGGDISLNTNISSQFFSALLLIAPTLDNGLRINISNDIVSFPYIEMTMKIMEYFGINIQKGKDFIYIKRQNYTAKDIEIEADWSSASYWYEIAALSSNCNITLKGLRKSKLQGDEIVSKIFENFGVKSEFKNESVILTKKGNINNHISLNCKDFPDLVPSIAFTCASLGISAELTGIGHLSYKESDRFDSIISEIKKIGVNCFKEKDTISIISSKLINFENIIFESHNDHRIALSVAPLALKSGKIRIADYKVVDKSYPQYWENLKNIGLKLKTV